ncbi:transcription termination factor 5, mitochondrial [Ixodes scapularis]
MLASSFKLSSLWKLARIPGPFGNQLKMCLSSSALQNSPSSESDAGYVDESEGSLAHQTHERIELLVDHLKCSTSSATSILMRNKKLLDIKQETLVKNMGILKALFPLKDILKHPEILSFQFGTAEQRYHNLEEMGVKTVTPGKVVGFQDIVTKPAYVLKRHRLIPTETDPAVHMLSFLDCPQSVQAEILSRLPLHYTLTMSMKAVKREVVRSYLSWRLKCSREEVAALIAKYPSVENRSLQFLRRTIEIATNNFNFTCKKIVSNGFVLLAHPNNLENLLCQVRHLAGMDVRQLGNLCPRLLTVPSENVVRVERLLHQYGISQAQAARCIGIYGLSPATIAARLQELDKVAEFQVRKECPRILNLVYYASKAKHRLELLSHLGYEAGVSMHVLSMGSKDFARVFYSGSDRGRSQETVEFLSKLLNRDEVEVKERLAHHPCSTLVSLLNARRVVDFLLAKGVSKEQLWYGIQVVLYDTELVSAHFASLPDQEELQPFSEWREAPELVELLVYFMERETRFTGVTKMEVPSSATAEDASPPVENLYFIKTNMVHKRPAQQSCMLPPPNT